MPLMDSSPFRRAVAFVFILGLAVFDVVAQDAAPPPRFDVFIVRARRFGLSLPDVHVELAARLDLAGGEAKADASGHERITLKRAGAGRVSFDWAVDEGSRTTGDL